MSFLIRSSQSLPFTPLVSWTLATTAAIATLTPATPAEAASARDVARVAVPTTVRIDNPLSPANGGSGVIIAEKRGVYTVLTANHVVSNPNIPYEIYTSKGETYPVVDVQTFQSTPDAPDLAVVTFEASEKQAIAALADSDQAEIGSGVYISGYPMGITADAEREYEFTSGIVSSRRSNVANGYNIRYEAVTRRGMSGGPVFDVNGRVLGIHGRGDRDAVVENEAAEQTTGLATTEIKTGFNAAIPVNTFLDLASSLDIDLSKVKIDDKEPDNDDVEEPSDEDVASWQDEFAAGVGMMLLRNLLNFPFRLF